MTDLFNPFYNWTVARFPSGDWTTGGSPDSPEYENCEVFVVPARSSKEAIKKAQAKRYRQRRKQLEVT